MAYTLWRGTAMIARAELSSGADPRTLSGLIAETPGLVELGAIIQRRMRSATGDITLQHVPSEEVGPAEGESKDSDRIEIWADSSAESNAPAAEVSADALLTVRDADSN